MDIETLIDIYPRLYHMAEAGSWASVKSRGLLSTSALLDLFEIEGPEREKIEAEHRPESVIIRHPEHGEAVIRDQKPLRESALIKCLIDMTPSQWYRILNGRVFFWTSEWRLERLLAARAYRDRVHDVIAVDTRTLVARHEENITLSPYNSGSTIFNPVPRGSATFSRIADYPFEEWRSKRSRRDAVVELAVEYSVADIGDLALRVERRIGATVEETVWQRG